jgi:hypothetical protein
MPLILRRLLIVLCLLSIRNFKASLVSFELTTTELKAQRSTTELQGHSIYENRKIGGNVIQPWHDNSYDKPV